MNLLQRIELLTRLGQYILAGSDSWMLAKQKAEQANRWFTQKFTDHAAHAIATQFLQAEKLAAFVQAYNIAEVNMQPKTIGLVMAGNIPLVGFHDWLCVFLSGHQVKVKASSKDDVLIKHLVGQLAQWNPAVEAQVVFADLLKGCDAYIATGSNNTARYFDYYFAKYPHIIRKNRTSVAILTGNESQAALEKLADDVHLYFGLGCRNVTKIYTPFTYDFAGLLQAFNKYAYLADHDKYKNNYDYQLAIHLLNNQFYMTNGTTLLFEDANLFSPISQVNYDFYAQEERLAESLQQNTAVQCIAGTRWVPFGQAQLPSLTDYADGVDTMQFCLGL